MNQKTTYNDPFYFAIPRASRQTPSGAAAHILKQFGVEGQVEFVRTNPEFSLYRINAEVQP